MRKKMPLDLVHTNVCYMDTKSHARSQYFVTSVLKMKDQVLFVFKEFEARAEKETDQKLKCVQAKGNTEGSSKSIVGEKESYLNTPHRRR